MHGLGPPSHRPRRSQGGAAPQIRPDEAAARSHQAPTTGEIARLTCVLEIDAAHQAALKAFIATIPGVRFFVFSTNDVRSGALPAGQLSRRLEQVLQLIRKGMTNKSIGRHLGISHFTVRNHVTRLLQIHGARNRDELIAITGAMKES